VKHSDRNERIGKRVKRYQMNIAGKPQRDRHARVPCGVSIRLRSRPDLPRQLCILEDTGAGSRSRGIGEDPSVRPMDDWNA